MSDDLLTSRARAMRAMPTDAEARLWHLLRGRRFSGWKFRRQARIGRYIVDFVCLERALVAEVDGGQHADSVYDATRDAWLAARGFRVMRFWNAEVLIELDGVAYRIAEALGLDWTP